MAHTETSATECTPTPARLTLCDMAGQFKRDLYGKEVQSAATYSYLWLADQGGHIALGLIALFVLAWIIEAFGWGKPPDNWWSLAIAIAGLCAYEYSAYRADVRRATGLFDLDKALLKRNAVTAAGYLVAGAAAGYAWHARWDWAAGVTAGLLVIGACFALFWYRQKIVWQKAGLPFLFRLADAELTMLKSDAIALQGVLDATRGVAGAAPASKKRAVLLTGPLNAGKTSLGCGIGTECAFHGLKVRYATFDKLSQMAAAGHDDAGPPNIGYWPWTESQVLLIDDIDPGNRTSGKPYMTVDEFKGIIVDYFGPYQPCLGRRLTVWVLGEKTDAERAEWKQAIETICGTQCCVIRLFKENDPEFVKLQPAAATP